MRKIVTSVNPNKLEELKRLQREGRSISYAEVLAVHWPQPTGTRYYAISRFDLAPNFQNLPWKPVQYRIYSRQGEGVEAIPYVTTHDANDDKISWEFIDHDLEITKLYVLHQSSAKVELLCYVAEIDQQFNLWWGLLDPHGGRRATLIKASATFGFRSPRGKIPRKLLSATTCQATFADLGTGCTYNLGAGGSIGNINSATGLPYSECPRNSRAVCLQRIGGDEKRLPYQAFSAVLGSETVEQSKGPNTLATTKGNDSALNIVLQLIFGKRKVRALPTRLYQIQTNTNKPEKGTVSAIFPVSDCHVRSITNPRINNVLVTSSNDSRNQFFRNLGEIGQAPLPLTSKQQADNASGVAEFRGLIFGAFGGKSAGDFTGSCDVEGCDEVRLWTGPQKGQNGYSTNRAECLRFLLENKRSGNGDGASTLVDEDWTELAERCNDQVGYSDAQGAHFTGPRSTFNAQVEGRQASQVIRDVCMAGFFTAPFPFEGKKRIFLIKDEPLDSSIPQFTNAGPDANVDWESVELIPTQGYDIVNAVTVWYEAAEFDYVRRPLTFNYTELQQLRGQALGDASEERSPAEHSLFGVVEFGEAVRVGNLIGDLGSFAAGGTKNPLRVRFRSARSFLEPEFLTLHPYKIIDLNFPELAPYREPMGEPARYFRVLTIQRLQNLQMEVLCQWWPYGYVSRIEDATQSPPMAGSGGTGAPLEEVITT